MKPTLLSLLVVLLINLPGFSKEKSISAIELALYVQQSKDTLLLASFKEAGLADEQVTKALSIVEENRKKKNALKKDTSLDKEVKSQRNKELSEEMKKELKALMGEDTYKKWYAIRRSQSNDK